MTVKRFVFIASQSHSKSSLLFFVEHRDTVGHGSGEGGVLTAHAIGVESHDVLTLFARKRITLGLREVVKLAEA